MFTFSLLLLIPAIFIAESVTEKCGITENTTEGIVSLEPFPWIVQVTKKPIGQNNQFEFSSDGDRGVILDEKHVLYFDVLSQDYTPVSVAFSNSRKSNVKHVESIHILDFTGNVTKHIDVALLTLEDSTDLTPICLPAEETTYEADETYYHVRFFTNNTDKLSKSKKEDFQICKDCFNHQNDKKLGQDYKTDESRLICTKEEVKDTETSHHFGSPLMAKSKLGSWELAGFSLFNTHCVEHGVNPTIFLNIVSAVKEIKAKLN